LIYLKRWFQGVKKSGWLTSEQAAKLELPLIEVDLIDIDKRALKVAKMNVDKFTLNIRILHSDLLAEAPKDYNVLLCNLPYVPDNHKLNQAATHEPRVAIFGGKDGLDLYRELFVQIRERPNKPLYILCENMPDRHELLTDIAKAAGYGLQMSEDFIQVFRQSP
jgi:HemK-like putative methylase